MVKSLWRRILAVGATLAMSGGMVMAIGDGAQAGASPAPLKVLFACTCSGPDAVQAVGKGATQAWQDAINAAGGVNGHKIDVIYDDDTGSPGLALSQVEKAINNGVIAILDNSGDDTAWITYAAQHNVPVMSQGDSQTATTSEDFFNVGETLDEYFTNFIDLAKKYGQKNLGEMYCAESPVCLQAVAPLQATGKAMHFPINFTAEVSSSAPNYTAQCLAAKQAGVQVISTATAPVVAENIAANCATQNYHPYFIALDGAVANGFATDPGLGSKFIGGEPDIPFFVTNTPATEAYQKALKKYAPGVLTAPTYSESEVQIWLMGQLFAAAAKAGNVNTNGPTGAKQLVKGLYSLHGETLGGMSPPLTFSKTAPHLVDCWYWISANGKKFTTPFGLTPDCVKPTPIS
jgi:branched-chain amino acid transport system substrate-binding protein